MYSVPILKAPKLAFLISSFYIAKQDEIDEGEHIPDEDEEKIVPEYRHLIAIHAGKPKGELRNLLSIDANKVRRLSMSEQELENAIEKHGTDIIR